MRCCGTAIQREVPMVWPSHASTLAVFEQVDHQGFLSGQQGQVGGRFARVPTRSILPLGSSGKRSITRKLLGTL
jgi:hypothetical protein